MKSIIIITFYFTYGTTAPTITTTPSGGISASRGKFAQNPNDYLLGERYGTGVNSLTVGEASKRNEAIESTGCDQMEMVVDAMRTFGLLEHSLNYESGTEDTSSMEIQMDTCGSLDDNGMEFEIEAGAGSSRSEEAQAKAKRAREGVKIIGNGEQFAAQGSDSECGIVFQENGNGFDCFKSKNLQLIDPESFNGFVFPASICNLPGVIIRAASVPYLAIKDLKYSNDAEVAAFEEIFNWSKGVAPVAAVMISPWSQPFEPVENMYKCLPKGNYRTWICINKAIKWTKDGTNDIGVVLIGGDTACFYNREEDGEVDEMMENKHKVWVERLFDKCTQMLSLRIAKDCNPYSAKHLHFFKLLYPNVPTFTVKYPEASIYFVINHKSHFGTDGGRLLLGFEDIFPVPLLAEE